MRSESPIRVLLVDDYGSLGGRVSALFESGELVPCPADCATSQMPDMVQGLDPDVILLEMGETDCLGPIETVMAERPTPILLIGNSQEHKVPIFKAMALGALDAVSYPENPSPDFWTQLRKKVALLATIQVVRHVQGARRKREAKANRLRTHVEPSTPLVVIASSLGGPKAIAQVLRGLPGDFGAPLCICQHISDGFTSGLAQWLRLETTMRVVEASEQELLKPGTVYIAPSGFHTTVRSDGSVKLEDTPPIQGLKPSCDVLLKSAAEAYGRFCTGVILTGMGKDGAAGMLEIRRHGGHTIAQDAASCVVYGMPKEAVQRGAIIESLPLKEIADALIKRVRS